MLKHIKGYICNGHTFVMRKSDVHNAPDNAFVDAIALLPMCEPKWYDAKRDLPPAGHRVIATNGEIAGEAYVVTVGGVSKWHRAYNVPWESWAREPVVAWMDMPDGKEYRIND